MISRYEIEQLLWLSKRARSKKSTRVDDFDRRLGQGEGAMMRARLSPLFIDEREGKLYLTPQGQIEASQFE